MCESNRKAKRQWNFRFCADANSVRITKGANEPVNGAHSSDAIFIFDDSAAITIAISINGWIVSMISPFKAGIRHLESSGKERKAKGFFYLMPNMSNCVSLYIYIRRMHFIFYFIRINVAVNNNCQLNILEKFMKFISHEYTQSKQAMEEKLQVVRKKASRIVNTHLTMKV